MFSTTFASSAPEDRARDVVAVDGDLAHGGMPVPDHGANVRARTLFQRPLIRNPSRVRSLSGFCTSKKTGAPSATSPPPAPGTPRRRPSRGAPPGCVQPRRPARLRWPRARHRAPPGRPPAGSRRRTSCAVRRRGRMGRPVPAQVDREAVEARLREVGSERPAVEPEVDAQPVGGDAMHEQDGDAAGRPARTAPPEGDPPAVGGLARRGARPPRAASDTATTRTRSAPRRPARGGRPPGGDRRGARPRNVARVAHRLQPE